MKNYTVGVSIPEMKNMAESSTRIRASERINIFPEDNEFNGRAFAILKMNHDGAAKADAKPKPINGRPNGVAEFVLFVTAIMGALLITLTTGWATKTFVIYCGIAVGVVATMLVLSAAAEPQRTKFAKSCLTVAGIVLAVEVALVLSKLIEG